MKHGLLEVCHINSQGYMLSACCPASTYPVPSTYPVTFLPPYTRLYLLKRPFLLFVLPSSFHLFSFPALFIYLGINTSFPLIPFY